MTVVTKKYGNLIVRYQVVKGSAANKLSNRPGIVKSSDSGILEAKVFANALVSEAGTNLAID